MELGYGNFHQETSEEFDTVLLAIGRTGEAHKLGLADAGASRLQTEGFEAGLNCIILQSMLRRMLRLRKYPFL